MALQSSGGLARSGITKSEIVRSGIAKSENVGSGITKGWIAKGRSEKKSECVQMTGATGPCFLCAE